MRADAVVGRWVSNEETSKSYGIPVGVYSWGVWFSQQNACIYRYHDRFDNLIGYRIDACKDVSIDLTKNSVEFNDLIVDLYIKVSEDNLINPKDTIVEDLDELDELRKNNQISMDDCKIIENIVSELLFTPENIISMTDTAIKHAVTIQ